jgi:hypothetical protein
MSRRAWSPTYQTFGIILGDRFHADGAYDGGIPITPDMEEVPTSTIAGVTLDPNVIRLKAGVWLTSYTRLHRRYVVFQHLNNKWAWAGGTSQEGWAYIRHDKGKAEAAFFNKDDGLHWLVRQAQEYL